MVWVSSSMWDKVRSRIYVFAYTHHCTNLAKCWWRVQKERSTDATAKTSARIDVLLCTVSGYTRVRVVRVAPCRKSLIACAYHVCQILSKINFRTELFNLMRTDLVLRAQNGLRRLFIFHRQWFLVKNTEQTPEEPIFKKACQLRTADVAKVRKNKTKLRSWCEPVIGMRSVKLLCNRKWSVGHHSSLRSY